MLSSVYLAYPIDQADLPPQFYDKVEEAKDDMVVERGVGWVYDPGDAFRVSRGAFVTGHVAEINNRALDLADGMLAFLPFGVPTIGVPIEIARAANAGKPVAVVTDIGGSWSLAGLEGVQTFEKRADAIEWLCTQDPPRQTTRSSSLPFVVGPNGTLPTRSYEDDAGFDLYVSEDVYIAPYEAVEVRTDVKVQLPSWSYGRLVSRSSTRRKRGLLVHEGTIDAGWRGELLSLTENMTNVGVTVRKGERIAQLIVQHNATRVFEAAGVDALTPHPRGENGFGSSGQ